MTITINGTTGIAGVDGSAGTPAVQGTDTNTGVFYPAADTVGVSTGGSERVRVDSSGNVGIGTSSPATQLHVSGTNAVLNITRSTKNFYLNPNYANGGSYATFESDLALATVVNGAERMRIDSSGNLQFNSGYGSVATAYGCRAWVNFNGTGTVAIRASGNVSSITDNGSGDYTVNFTTAMPDANYAVAGLSQRNASAGNVSFSEILGSTAYDRLTTSGVRVASRDQATNANDALTFCVSVFR